MYEFGDKIAMIATDRISAFDVVLPQPIPYKGQVLNTLAAKSLYKTRKIVPNWVESVPHSHVTFGKKCEPFKVEMVVRGYLTGHAWREYQAGARSLCGVEMPDGMHENERFKYPILTPTTKADQGHDEDISREEILDQQIVSEEHYLQLEKYSLELFRKGTEIATLKGLILVDTKYEFGLYNGEIYLIDEVHTPDSSRYFYLNDYRRLFEKGLPQRQLSKEFVRQWLISEGFQGKANQKIPQMTSEKIKEISDRYIELYNNISGSELVTTSYTNILNDIHSKIAQITN